ncbi:MAG: DUF4351 domain-containing protein [Sphaerospermopsis kisseleviana]
MPCTKDLYTLGPTALALACPWRSAKLIRRFGSLEQACRERLASQSLPYLEQLAEDLLDFTEPAELQGWLARHTDA